MENLQAFNVHGVLVKHGDTVLDFRGEPGVFDKATRAPEPGRAGKVRVNGRESYQGVWGLTVKQGVR